MGGRKDERNDLAANAMQELGVQQDVLEGLQTTYNSDLNDLKKFDIQNFYKDYDPETGEGIKASLNDINSTDFAQGKRTGETFARNADGSRTTAQAKKINLADAAGYGGNVDTFDAFQTDPNIQGLARRGNSGLSNTMNNLQVSTAGAEMAAQEADQSLAASQDLAAQAGTGAGGATALAAAAARSKQGIAADIDSQVKSNEQMRASAEQSLQRDQLGQDNLSSNFDLGASQFNVGQQNSVRSQAMAANNQARQFDATQQNQFAQSRFSAENQRQQFNASQSNAERMAEFGALQNANAANAAAINNALAQNSQTQTNFDLGQAAGNTANDAAEYGQTNDILNLSTEALNNANASNDALQQIEAAGNASQGNTGG